MRTIPTRAKPFLEELEGRRKKVYLDSAGIPTVGIGHTGPDVVMGDTWTDGRIDAAWVADIGEARDEVYRCLPAATVEGLTGGQFTALLAFTFNLGPKAQKGNIWRRIREGNLSAVPTELAKWNKVTLNGQLHTLPGLVKRRAREGEMWLSDTSVPAVFTSTTASAGEVTIEPTFTDTTERKKSVGVLAILATPFLAGWSWVTQHVEAAVQMVVGIVTPDHVNRTLAAVQPYVEKSNYVAQAAQGIAVVGAIVGAVVVWRKIKEGQQ